MARAATRPCCQLPAKSHANMDLAGRHELGLETLERPALDRDHSAGPESMLGSLKSQPTRAVQRADAVETAPEGTRPWMPWGPNVGIGPLLPRARADTVRP